MIDNDLDHVKAFLVHFIGDIRENEHLVGKQFLFFGIRGIFENSPIVAKPIYYAFRGIKGGLVQGIYVFLNLLKGILKIVLACHDLLLWKQLFVLKKKVEIHYNIAQPDGVVNVIFLPVHGKGKHQAEHNLLEKMRLFLDVFNVHWLFNREPMHVRNIDFININSIIFMLKVIGFKGV